MTRLQVSRSIARLVACTLGLHLAVSVPGARCPAAEAFDSPEASPYEAALGKGFRFVGSFEPRHARDIKSSNWSVGAETMDRDFTVYANWRQYLGPLGAKKARIQSGWAKTEKERGVYDWAWVDEIVLDMVEQGVEPWVCLCYGNPIYPGGGDTGLGGGLVASEEALQAWERYVAAFVERYAEHVDEWELWNEPRTGRGKGSIQYAQFVIRTAEVIRKQQPDAEILFAAGGAFDTQFAKEVLEYLREQDKLDLVNKIIYHPYSYNPDDSYGAALGLRKMAQSFAPHIDIRQGENGAPSQPGSFGAIANNDWTERSQAKWALRRLLGDLGHDIPSSYFAICDMQYPQRVNYKGLLAINADKTVHHAKQAYRAVQNVTAAFDDSIQRVTDAPFTIEGTNKDSTFSVFIYRNEKKEELLTVWRNNDRPGVRSEVERVTITLPTIWWHTHTGYVDMYAATVADLLTGRIYALPKSSVEYERGAQGIVFRDVPVYDSPVVLANLGALPFAPPKDPPCVAAVPGDGYRLVGEVKPRHAREIAGSNWSVGAETMDRDYTIYKNWKKYLGPLGAKHARIQSGWAKTEKEKGKYDFAWLDEIVPDMVEQGVEPWMCLCYGNPDVYGRGGGLGWSVPTSPEALKAWEKYVAAVVERYGRYIDDWEIWNEPASALEEYAALVVRTAKVIRRIQPEARIIVAAWREVTPTLDYLKEHDGLKLVNEFTIHPYAANPDRTYSKGPKTWRVGWLREQFAAYADHITLRQGENGVPSVAGSHGALPQYDWSEPTQAKWALRRLLGDLGRDVPSSYFGICDMRYPGRTNYKGLLAVNDDKTVHHVKPAYYAVQHVTAIFDNTVHRMKDFSGTVQGGAEGNTYSLFSYCTDSGAKIAALWRDSHRPGECPDIEHLTITLPEMQFTQPVWVDLLSGKVYQIEGSRRTVNAGSTMVEQVPVYDSVVLIAEQAAIPLVPSKPD